MKKKFSTLLSQPRLRGPASLLAGAGLLVAAGSITGCTDPGGLDATDPGRGPGSMVGNGDPVSDGDFPGGNDKVPEPRADAVPGEECDMACRSYCDGLDLQNPINKGICGRMWGVGLESRPIDRKQACRRLYADMLGRFPDPEEVNSVCNKKEWGNVVKTLLDTDEFILRQQRLWADKLLYNNRAISIERIYDMDELVEKTYGGYVAWDQFAAVTSAHPILTRRHDTGGDRAEALFKLFLGRPPYESERADMGRLYALWNNDYFEHPYLGTLPDATIEFKCVDDNGKVDPNTSGACTSINWGYNQLVLEPDVTRMREEDGLMWSGYLKPNEWEKLQLPGRIMASQPAFWEWAVDDAMMQYLGYDMGTVAPEVRHEMVKYLLAQNGDIRAAHFAVATSIPYLQSSQGGYQDELPWTEGPLKQTDAETWLDSIKWTTGYQLSVCDHRMPHPDDYLEEEMNDNAWAHALVVNSRWELNEEDEVVGDYRGLAQTLGGCPTNEATGRFTTVSILNTAVQESFVAEVCGLLDDGRRVPIETLLPSGMKPGAELNESRAAEILTRQSRLFLGREPHQYELDDLSDYVGQCSPKPCSVEDFARPTCFALMSSSEMLFY